MPRDRTIKRGDKVAVPWGLDEVVGVVLEVYGPPACRSAPSACSNPGAFW